MAARDIRVRAARPDDAEAIATLGQSTFRTTYEPFSKAADMVEHLDKFFGIRAVRDRLAANQTVYLLAEVEDQLAGFIKLRDTEHPQGLEARQPLELQQVYVSPDFQRLGIGGRLIESALAEGRERGCDVLWLSVWEEATWAVNCYLKYGFEIRGDIDFKLGETVYADRLMVLNLTR